MEEKHRRGASGRREETGAGVVWSPEAGVEGGPPKTRFRDSQRNCGLETPSRTEACDMQLSSTVVTFLPDKQHHPFTDGKNVMQSKIPHPKSLHEPSTKLMAAPGLAKSIWGQTHVY